MAGELGPVTCGALLELGIHLLDLIRFLTGEEIRDVQCTMTPAPDVGPENQVQAHIRTTTGVSCTLDIARVDRQRRGTAEWTGMRGTIRADWVTRTLSKIADDGTSRTWTLESRPTILETLKSFLDAIRTGSPPPITGRDGCLAVEAADACYRSAAANGECVTCERAATAGEQRH